MRFIIAIVLIGLGIAIWALIGSTTPTSTRTSRTQATSDPVQTSYPLPSLLVKSWAEAGARHGWIQRNSESTYCPFVKLEDGEPGDLPGFEFSAWNADSVRTLPAPRIPFGVDLGYQQVDNDSLKHLAGMPTLQFLQASCAKLEEGAFKEIGRMTDLRVLALGHTQITDADLKYLASLNGLRTLDLTDAENITDAGLPWLAVLKDLEYISLSGTGGVTDEGLRTLASLPKLRSLHLNGTQVTADGLIRESPPLRKLRRLCLMFCDGVTEVGAERIQKALPQVKVVR